MRETIGVIILFVTPLLKYILLIGAKFRELTKYVHGYSPPLNKALTYSRGDTTLTTFQTGEKCCATQHLGKHWAVLQVSSHM